MYQKSWWYELQFLRYRAWQMEFLSFWKIFCHFTPLKTRKSIFWKYKKMPRDVWLYVWLYDDHMMYGSWDMECDKHNFLSFWTTFALPDNHVNRNFEKTKNENWRYYHFTHMYHKWQLHDLWFIRYGEWWTELLSFWTTFLPFFTSKNLEKQNFEKMKKMFGNIIS